MDSLYVVVYSIKFGYQIYSQKEVEKYGLSYSLVRFSGSYAECQEFLFSMKR